MTSPSYYRISTGLQIDLQSTVTTGVGGPSGVNQDSSPIGSLYMENDTATNLLNIWYKFQSTTSTIADWAQLASKLYVDTHGGGTSLKLYTENPVVGYISPSALGNNAVGIGYAANAGAVNSLAIGEQSQSRIQGGVVQASGRFASTGDAQTGRYLVRTVTTNGSVTEAFVDGVGGSVRLVLLDNSTWNFRVTVTAQRADVANGWAGYELKGVIYRVIGASSVALQGIISSEQIGATNQAWKVTATPDTVNGSLKITVKGETGKQIRWLALVETVEVTD